MFSFLGKNKPRAVGSPAQRVSALSGQGLSEPEIINTLRKEGYSPKEVDGAMKEALRSAATATPLRLPPRDQFAVNPPAPQPYDDQYPPASDPAGYQAPGPGMQPQRPRLQPPPLDDDDLDAPLPGELDMPELPGMRRTPASPQRPPATRGNELDDLDDIESLPLSRGPSKVMRKHAEMEEMAEGVVEEKWIEFDQEVKDLKDDFKSLETKVATLEQAIRDIKGTKTGDNEDIKVRLDAYRQSITEVNTRLEGMERAVKDSLTPMMQTMRSLTEALKATKGVRSSE